MKPATNKTSRLKWHLRIPCCETREGVIQHLKHTNCNELRFLCQMLNCNIEVLTDRFWRRVKELHGWM